MNAIRMHVGNFTMRKPVVVCQVVLWLQRIHTTRTLEPTCSVDPHPFAVASQISANGLQAAALAVRPTT